GVQVGGAFFGESMFSRVSEASKLALLSLVEILRERQFGLLDIQWVTDHLEMCGAVEVRRAVYLRMLQDALAPDCVFHAPGEWPMWNRLASRERELAV
ncbi:MAG: leucyl/phenylalanyl-tRNA--protein transferase, partial [Chthoniobacterales bacterium]